MSWTYKLCPVCYKVHKDGQPKCIYEVTINGSNEKEANQITEVPKRDAKKDS